MIRVVIDTNVLVSAMIAPSGNESLVVLGARQVLICEEYSGVLAGPKFGF